ncbi:hypothetical protein [Actinoalloteichus caeruleus]|uniref:Uncharacterized protein n=2 Tax=Actinoalloteichus cyanogriseus TaxID=2893586 RepID=A0ABT1JGL5_ACTCY|nr:hypothetical protein [Actinoalloteichus caeruleus]MCP2331318.1 hypothetical protein [Actinoalloteichus caeruleus DSM 43889]
MAAPHPPAWIQRVLAVAGVAAAASAVIFAVSAVVDRPEGGGTHWPAVLGALLGVVIAVQCWITHARGRGAGRASPSRRGPADGEGSRSSGTTSSDPSAG